MFHDGPKFHGNGKMMGLSLCQLKDMLHQRSTRQTKHLHIHGQGLNATIDLEKSKYCPLYHFRYNILLKLASTLSS